jgi:hypothetical protein
MDEPSFSYFQRDLEFHQTESNMHHLGTASFAVLACKLLSVVNMPLPV